MRIKERQRLTKLGRVFILSTIGMFLYLGFRDAAPILWDYAFTHSRGFLPVIGMSMALITFATFYRVT